MSRSRNRHIVEGGEIFSGQRGVEMAAPRAHFWSRFGCSVVLRDSLWPLCCAFRNLTPRTQRKAPEGTEGSTKAV